MAVPSSNNVKKYIQTSHSDKPKTWLSNFQSKELTKGEKRKNKAKKKKAKKQQLETVIKQRERELSTTKKLYVSTKLSADEDQITAPEKNCLVEDLH